MSLVLNDKPVGGTLSLGEGWQEVEITLPESALRQGLNTLALRFDHATRPSDVLPGVSDERTLSAAVDWMEVGRQ
jgi:hypothetical protein